MTMQDELEKEFADSVFGGYSVDGPQGTEPDIVLYRKVKAWIGRAEIKSNIEMLNEIQKDLAYDPTSLMHRRVEEKLFILRRLKEQTGEKAQVPKA